MNCVIHCEDCEDVLIQWVGASPGQWKKHVEDGKLGPLFACACGSRFELKFDADGHVSMVKIGDKLKSPYLPDPDAPRHDHNTAL